MANTFIYLSKILPLFVMPLGIVLTLITVGLIFKNTRIIILGVAVLVLSSLPIVSNSIWTQLEAQYPRPKIDSIPPADAIIVLSGMLVPTEKSDSYIQQWHDPDRFFAAVELFQHKKSPTIIFTGGKMPWGSGAPEGELLAVALKRYIDIDPLILITEDVANTAEEATAVRSVAQNKDLKTFILVTSSYHMPRAVQIFRSAGLDVIPFATDHRSQKIELSVFSFVPSASSLSQTSNAIRELLGRVIYRLIAPKQ